MPPAVSDTSFVSVRAGGPAWRVGDSSSLLLLPQRGSQGGLEGGPGRLCLRLCAGSALVPAWRVGYHGRRPQGLVAAGGPGGPSGGCADWQRGPHPQSPCIRRAFTAVHPSWVHKSPKYLHTALPHVQLWYPERSKGLGKGREQTGRQGCGGGGRRVSGLLLDCEPREG